MANGKQLSQKGADFILDLMDSYIDVKEAAEGEDKMKRFDEVISRLCEVYKARHCSVLSIKGNVIKVQSHSTTFYDNLAYFQAVCECYMETYYHSTAWIISIDTADCIIELGCNY